MLPAFGPDAQAKARAVLAGEVVEGPSEAYRTVFDELPNERWPAASGPVIV